MKASNEEIIQLIKDVKEADTSIKDTFAELITRTLQCFEDSEKIEKELSREFGTPKTTIRRWANKVSAPLPSVRKFVYEYIIGRLENILIERLSGI